MGNNRYIPQALKREIRKEAHFGCVLCGSPIIEFHHIVPYHEVKEHTAVNLVALCPEHHHRADCSEIPIAVIRNAKAKPFNRDTDFISKDFFLSTYSELRTRVGSNIFIRTPRILIVDGHPLITITPDPDGQALLNAKFFNLHNVLLAEIRDNEWIAYKNPLFWDISYSPGHLKISRSKGSIYLEFKLVNGNVDLRAEMFYHGYRVRLLPDKTIIGDSNIISNSIIQDCGGGISISTGL